MMKLHLSTFRHDVTPPMGHPLCGGWIKPVVAVDDALESLGIVILGAGSPIVICAVDWTGILNDAYREWRDALADAAHTTPDRVTIHSVHQHNAPFVCLQSEDRVSRETGLGHNVDRNFFDACVNQGAESLKNSLKNLRPITQVATSSAKVEQVASNRRLLGPDGKVSRSRQSSCKDPQLRAEPEGLIDPQLRTISLCDNEETLATLHHYAVHPMSFYGDGRVTSDFVGLARKKRQSSSPSNFRMYFTGCAGNIAAGKYNDGSPQARIDLTDRIHHAMKESESKLKPEPIKSLELASTPVRFAPRDRWTAAQLESRIADSNNSAADRHRSAMELTWINRQEEKSPEIIISALGINNARQLHLPSECFVEYQLRAQHDHPDQFVATAAYGDGGPWYIPVESAYPQGGYEVEMAFCSPKVDQSLQSAIDEVMNKLPSA